jgi:hypothetical protein
MKSRFFSQETSRPQPINRVQMTIRFTVTVDFCGGKAAFRDFDTII